LPNRAFAAGEHSSIETNRRETTPKATQADIKKALQSNSIMAYLSHFLFIKYNLYFFKTGVKFILCKNL